MDPKLEKVSTGIEHLDKLINSFNIGDNVVWQVETGAFVELFCQSYVKQSLKDKKKVVIVNFNNSPRNIIDKMGSAANNSEVTLIDCFTSGKGAGAKIFLDLYQTRYKNYKCRIMHVENPGDPSEFIKVINKIEETYPRGTRYIFDSLTGMQDLWGGEEQITKFFTRQCPRLYELDTIAYWVVEKNAHTPQFRAQLSHITQVVIDLSIENGFCNLVIIKAENRSSNEILKTHSYEVVDSNIEFLSKFDPDSINMGKRIKEVRLEKELSQAQLAKEAGVTPSTISQVENNSISLSVPALLRVAKALNVSINTLLDDKSHEPFHFLFRAKHRSSADAAASSDDEVIKRSIIPDNLQSGMEAHIIEIQPGTKLGHHFFANKGSEFGYLLSGTVELQIKKRTFVMNEGDAVFFTSDTPGRWENSTTKTARLLWVVTK